MPVDFTYCNHPDHESSIIIGVGQSGTLGDTCIDGHNTNTILISDIDEPEFLGEEIIMSDDTVINDSDGYLSYFLKYIP